MCCAGRRRAALQHSRARRRRRSGCAQLASAHYWTLPPPLLSSPRSHSYLNFFFDNLELAEIQEFCQAGAGPAAAEPLASPPQVSLPSVGWAAAAPAVADAAPFFFQPQACLECKGVVIFTGVGKSGLIAQASHSQQQRRQLAVGSGRTLLAAMPAMVLSRCRLRRLMPPASSCSPARRKSARHW